MLKGIDISHWQKGFNLKSAKPGFAIVKATEGVGYVDPCCDGFVQDAIASDIPFGFYHFARFNSAAAEAKYFYENTKGYIGKGIPVLDFEVLGTNAWVEEWCKTYYQLSNVYPWVYMNSNYVNNKKYGTSWVKEHCGLWLAGYPTKATAYPTDTTCPYKHDGWTLAAWQFTSSLAMGGMSIDGDIFYGDRAAWNKYAGATTQQATKALTAIEIWQYARDVINGYYGEGEARRKALGSNYDTVQTAVNQLLKASNTELAKIVITGAMGNGATRKEILGGRYAAVQKEVNKLV